MSILEACNLARNYALPRTALFGARPVITAVRDVSLQIAAGETLGIVGESGSGKSTLARLLMVLEKPDRGTVHWLGEAVSTVSAQALRVRRRHVQMVFQDPFGSLNPRMRILDSVAEPLDVAEPALSAADRRDRVEAMLSRVGLEAEAMSRYPHQFSGGQRQRIAIARALITDPKLLIADEPVSALDVSIQAQILNLLTDLQRDLGLAMIIISHDLGVVRYLADRVMVMQHGKVVEEGDSETIFAQPSEDYTRRLISAVMDA